MAEPEETSTLTAIFGKERADTVRKFAKKRTPNLNMEFRRHGIDKNLER